MTLEQAKAVILTFAELHKGGEAFLLTLQQKALVATAKEVLLSNSTYAKFEDGKYLTIKRTGDRGYYIMDWAVPKTAVAQSNGSFEDTFKAMLAQLSQTQPADNVTDLKLDSIQ